MFLVRLGSAHIPPPPPESSGISVSVNPFTLIFLAVVGYVVYRVLQARRRGESGTKAAATAMVEAAPPAIAVGIGLVFLYLAMVVLLIMFVFGVMSFAFTVPMAIIEGIFRSGAEPAYSFGPFDELGWQAFGFMFLAMLMFMAAMLWVTVAAVRRARRAPASVAAASVAPASVAAASAEPEPAPAGPAPGAPVRQRPLRAAGR